MPERSLFISVVITCYNYGRYLAGAIESALSQSYPHVEIIVIDDGSTDDSALVAARYENRVRLIRQSNAGHIAAYCRGFEAAHGDVLVFLDADDLLEPNCLQEVAAVWSPGCVKVQYDLKIIDAEGHDLGRTHSGFVGEYSSEEVARSFRETGTYRWPVTTGNAYARWFVERMMPLRPNLGPDGILNTSAPLYGEIKTIARPLGSYRLHGANIWASGGSDWQRVGRRIDARREELEIMQQHAATLGVALPASDSLDHELPFLTYRLTAKRLGIPYRGHEVERPAALLGKTLRHLFRESYPLRSRAIHTLWALSMTAAPQSWARTMLKLRYERGGVRELAARATQALSIGTRGVPVQNGK